MSELTDADRAAINSAYIKFGIESPHYANPVDELIYLAGAAAERERCAKICDEISYSVDIEDWVAMSKKEHGTRACRECAAAIRAQRSNDA